jgi:hypothetical protein
MVMVKRLSERIERESEESDPLQEIRMGQLERSRNAIFMEDLND